jgi:parvulin-like peptidyl-prolyl isomerase
MVKKKNSKVKPTIVTIAIVLLIAAGIAGLYYRGLIRFKMPETKDIAATVNGEEITQQELDVQYELFFTLVGYPEEYKEQITKEVYLNQMVVEELMLQEAEKIGVSPLLVSDKQLKESLDAYLKANGLALKQLAESLVDKGLTTEDLELYFKKQIAINNFLNETMLGKMTVTEEEINGFYDQNIESFTAQEGQIRARHILVETEKEADDIIQELRSGADFAELAEEKSLDTVSGERGGELGFFSKGMMVKEFEDAAFELTVNKISKPIKTDFGWHVIQREADKIPMDEVKDLISDQLSMEKQRVTLQTYLEQLKAKADISIIE